MKMKMKLREVNVEEQKAVEALLLAGEGKGSLFLVTAMSRS
jgi:hypothetical protein